MTACPRKTSGVATYLQLVQQVHQALRMGMLEPGDRLPTAQQVVAQLAINPDTVHKAYRELEREGLVRARPGPGMFVTRLPSGTDPATQARFLAELAGWLRSARAAGLGPDDIQAIYRTAFRDWPFPKATWSGSLPRTPPSTAG